MQSHNFVVRVRQWELLERQVEWLSETLRDVGVVLVIGAILGGIIGEFDWQAIVVSLLASFILWYISFELIKGQHD